MKPEETHLGQLLAQKPNVRIINNDHVVGLLDTEPPKLHLPKALGDADRILLDPDAFASSTVAEDGTVCFTAEGFDWHLEGSRTTKIKP